MTTIRVKKGDKQHFIHKSRDIPLPVHLGTDARAARKKLVTLKSSRTKHDRLNEDIEKLQYRLKKTACFGKPAEEHLADVKRNHFRQKSYDKMVSEDRNKNRTEQAAILATLVFCSLIFMGYLLGAPMITGSAVLGSGIALEDLAVKEFTVTVIVFLAVVSLALTTLHLKFHFSKTKHSEYMP